MYMSDEPFSVHIFNFTPSNVKSQPILVHLTCLMINKGRREREKNGPRAKDEMKRANYFRFILSVYLSFVHHSVDAFHQPSTPPLEVFKMKYDELTTRERPREKGRKRAEISSTVNSICT